MGKLNSRQKRFCDEYLVDLNATQAAIRAGYSEKYANTNAGKLLQNTAIKEYVRCRIEDREKRTEITQDMVLRELALIAFSDATDYARIIEKQVENEEGRTITYRTVEPVLTEELTKEQRRALAVIKKGRDGFEVKTYSKTEALKLLGAHLGMWDKKGEADMEEQQARIEKLKAETARIKGEDPESDKQDDGFIAALKGEVDDIWDET